MQKKVKQNPEIIPDIIPQEEEEEEEKLNEQIYVPSAPLPKESLRKTPRGAWIRRLPSQEPPAVPGPAEPAEEGGGAEKTQLSQLQKCAAAALAKQFQIPLPAAEAAATAVDRALVEAAAADWT